MHYESAELIKARKLFWVVLCLAFMLHIQVALWYLVIHFPYVLASQILMAGMVVCGASSYLVLVRSPEYLAGTRPSARQPVSLFMWMTVGLAVYGLLRGNTSDYVRNETASLLLIAYLYAVGMVDGMWRSVDKFFTVFFYVSVLLALMTLKISAGVDGNVAETVRSDGFDIGRHTDSVGYQVKGAISAVIFLFPLGLLGVRTGLWRFAQSMTLVVAVVLNVGVFMFRGAVILYAMLLGMCVVHILKRGDRRARRCLFFALAVIVASVLIFGFFHRELFTGVTERWRTGGGATEAIKSDRLSEAVEFFRAMKMRALVGSGIGGTYDASVIWNNPEGRTIHTGILYFVLKGGVAYLFAFSLFLTPIFRRRSRLWFEHPLNACSSMALPFILLNLIGNPMLAGMGHTIVQSVTFMLLARCQCVVPEPRGIWT